MLKNVSNRISFGKDFFSTLWLPVALLLSYGILALILKDILPSSEEILMNFSKFFTKYGYELIFIGAFLEAALIIDLIAPGASVVLLGAYFSSLGLLSYPIFLIVAAAGFTLGYLLDYLIGYYGWADIIRKAGFDNQLKAAEQKISKMGWKAFFLGYIHPDLATVFALAAGILQIGIRKFLIYNFFAGFFWLLIWTGSVYIFGSVFQKVFEDYSFIALFIVPVFFLIFKYWWDKE